MAHGEWTETTRLIESAVKILAEIQPATIRQLFYQLVVAQVIENCERDYKRVSRTMTIARRDGRVPFEAIVDRSRQTYFPSNWSNLHRMAEDMESQLKQYRRDFWQDQPCYVELVIEKDALSGSIEEVRRDYGLILSPVRGFDSLSNVYELSQRLLMERLDDKRVVVLYMGDWDPSGECIEQDLKRRIQELMLGDFPEGERGLSTTKEICRIEMRRIAIHKSDIADYKLPALKVKPTDSRTAAFVKKHGKKCVELDALKPSVLRARLTKWIEAIIDHEAWGRAKLVERAQRQTCARYADVFREMGRAE